LLDATSSLIVSYGFHGGNRKYMKNKLFLLALASAAAFGGTISTAGASNVGPVVATDITGFATTGNLMGGLVIVGDFASGADATCTWVNLGGNAGGCTAVGGGANGFSLALNGDTFSASWNLSSILGANLLSLTFNGLPGSTVFDRTSPSTGTSGSDQGNDAAGSTNPLISFDPLYLIQGLATYQNPVGTLANAPVGDIHATVFLEFTDLLGGADGLRAGNTAAWTMDTDNIGLRGGDPGSGVPEPSTFGMVGAGLVGLAWLRRTRK
jgi:hypothetical protein